MSHHRIPTWFSEVEDRSIVGTLVRCKHVGDADRSRRIHRKKINVPVAGGTAALDRPGDPTELLHPSWFHVQSTILPVIVSDISAGGCKFGGSFRPSSPMRPSSRL